MSRYVVSEENRNQMSFMSFEDMIDENNPVRVIEAFIDSLDMKVMGFTHAETKETGRKPYNPADIMKLYSYGYFNGIRSSRKLEKECTRNIEVMWLLDGIKPDFRTISDFRKDNITILKKVFKQFSMLCDALGLYGKEIVAIDGSKFRANNSRKKNYTKGKIQKQLEHFEETAQKYIDLLQELDEKEENNETIKLDKDEIKEKIAGIQSKINELTKLAEKVEQEGEISLTDPDSRHMSVSNNGTDIAHNVQVAVDGKHSLIISVDVVSNAADQGQLYNMAEKAKEALGVETITVLADKGYGVGEDLRKCEENGITPIVSIQDSGTHTGNSNYTKEKFTYKPEGNYYVCPQGQHLMPKANGLYSNTNACKQCEFKDECTKSKRGRSVTRGEYQEELDRSRQRVADNKDLYRQRQMIVEHPFGTIKRAFGYTYFLLRKNEKVMGESVMHFFVYNLKRVINIKGVKEIIAAITHKNKEITV